MPSYLDIFAGISLNLLFGFAAYRKGSVTPGGCVTGILVGSVIYFSGGLHLWSILAGFFLSSTILGKVGRSKKNFQKDMHEKLDRRDSWQVLANCAIASLCAVMYYVTRDMLFLAGFLAAFAASTADTWASEIGVLSRNDPFMIIGLKRVPRGTSGAISVLGSIVSFAGAAFIPLIYWMIMQFCAFGSSFRNIHTVGTLIIFGGVMGSLADSILGATVQARYRCAVTGKVTEKTLSRGLPTAHIGGLRIINNDMVNFLSNCFAVAVTLFLYAWLMQ